jgi:hypothetical protein
MFVGNVSVTVPAKLLCSKFKQFGKIVSSRFRSCPVKDRYSKQTKKFGVMRKDFIDGVEDTKLSQNAYIVFDSPAAVKAAVESGMSGADLFGTGHIIRLDYIGKSANKTSDTSEMVINIYPACAINSDRV